MLFEIGTFLAFLAGSTLVWWFYDGKKKMKENRSALGIWVLSYTFAYVAINGLMNLVLLLAS